jgi:hypothetical protein
MLLATRREEPAGSRRYVWQPHAPESARPDSVVKGGIRVNLARHKNTTSDMFPLKPLPRAGGGGGSGGAGRPPVVPAATATAALPPPASSSSASGSAMSAAGRAATTTSGGGGAARAASTSGSSVALAASARGGGGGGGSSLPTMRSATGLSVLSTARSSASERTRAAAAAAAEPGGAAAGAGTGRSAPAAAIIREVRERKLELIAELRDLEALEAEAIALKSSRSGQPAARPARASVLMNGR